MQIVQCVLKTPILVVSVISQARPLEPAVVTVGLYTLPRLLVGHLSLVMVVLLFFQPSTVARKERAEVMVVENMERKGFCHKVRLILAALNQIGQPHLSLAQAVPGVELELRLQGGPAQPRQGVVQVLLLELQ